MRPRGPKKVRNFLIKQVQTMMFSKVSWRKTTRPKYADVICTRLILQAVFPTVKKRGFQRGSERTICLCKDLSRTGMGGARPTLLPVLIYAPPGQADNFYLLSKINDNCCSNTCPGSHQSRHTIPTKKRMLPQKAASSYGLFGSVLIHFQQDLEQLLLLFGCLGGKKFITLERDISAAIILPTQLLKQPGHREVECGGNFLNAFNGGILFATLQLTDIRGVAAGYFCQLLLTEPGPCPVISDSLTNSFCDFTHRRNTPLLDFLFQRIKLRCAKELSQCNI